jgi:thioredoxin-like negative regulator of GroEL
VIEGKVNWGAQMKRITADNIDQEVLSIERPSVVLFKSNSCHLCNELWPYYKTLEKRFGEFKFCYIDTESETRLGKIFSIDGVPSIYVIYKGESWEVDYPDEGYTEEYLNMCLGSFFVE